jgi:hypothetical protein
MTQLEEFEKWFDSFPKEKTYTTEMLKQACWYAWRQGMGRTAITVVDRLTQLRNELNEGE